MLDPKVFKAYDVRGIYPEELDEEGAYAIGRAYVQQFEPRRIAVGRDMRLSSPQIAAAVMRGAADEGAEVLDLGLVGTEMVYFAVGELELDGGIMVTASHNPKEYTGMKIVRRGRAAGRRRVGAARRARPGGCGCRRRGRRRRRRVGVRHLAGVRRSGAVVHRRVGAAAAEGRDRRGERDGRRDAAAGARAAAAMSRRCGASSIRTGRSRITSRTRCCRRTASSSSRRRSTRAPISASRSTATPTGASSSTTAASSSRATSRRRCSRGSVLEKEPGAKIIYDVRASWAVPETILAAGGVPLINRVGHAYIKHRMRKEHAAFGGEVSGHYYFREFSQADSGVVPFLMMLELISKRRAQAVGDSRAVPVAVLHHGRAEHAGGGRRAEAAGAEGAVLRRRARCRISTASRSTADDWHFNVRPSNTEPLLRLNLEARSQELMEHKRDEVLGVISGLADPCPCV